ncbi:MAG: signal recognition particle-docking protein FtsY [Deltaproteobacteria bacterium]|nr:MAG: signal recognition particle-docking protein FtsY [Deltaproteobacteria bacterium]
MVSFKKDNIGSDSKQFIKQDLFSRLKRGLTKTRDILNTDVMELVQEQQEIDEDLLAQFEDQLMMADVGIEATQYISNHLSDALLAKKLNSSEDMYRTLQASMNSILINSEQPLHIDREKKPFVILMTGINGAGKTTTIGKMARQFKDNGLSVMLAAGDTFRAAAVEQLQEWGKRLDVPVISQSKGADAASVIYDALQSAQARQVDVLIADTAGRLHTQSNLMNELEKIKRVISKLDPTAPHETMLVLDAGTGQNALVQAKHFNEAIGISGITLTKLDGTAKGGIVFSIAQQMKLPIRYIGIGETAQDLRVFDSKEFIKALLSH